MNIDLEKKYIKYKLKYLDLKNNTKTNLTNTSSHHTQPVKAVAFFSHQEISGTVKFEETNDEIVLISVDLEGFKPNTIHGFHIHEYGDLTKGCESMCAHFNPFNKTHGGPNDAERHVGDLGNLEANFEGKVSVQFTDNLIKLRGDHANIVGRGLIIHADPDDYGKGTYSDSKITGHAGKRIGCAIIGYSS